MRPEGQGTSQPARVWGMGGPAIYPTGSKGAIPAVHALILSFLFLWLSTKATQVVDNLRTLTDRHGAWIPVSSAPFPHLGIWPGPMGESRQQFICSSIFMVPRSPCPTSEPLVISKQSCLTKVYSSLHALLPLKMLPCPHGPKQQPTHRHGTTSSPHPGSLTFKPIFCC